VIKLILLDPMPSVGNGHSPDIAERFGSAVFNYTWLTVAYQEAADSLFAD